jgi:polyhydroxyalkanoate synthesis repressor PhaR
MSELRLIKKYPNRRLYDTRESRYITLQDIGRLLNQQADIRVRDQRSGLDITRSVLLQVVVELETTELARLSTPFLLNLVRSYATTEGAATAQCLEQTLEAHLSSVRLPPTQKTNQMGADASRQVGSP